MLGLLIYNVSWPELMKVAREVDLRYLAISAILMPVNLSLDAYAWQTLVRRLYPEERFSDTLGAVLCGQALALFTPAQIGDFVGRAYYLKFDKKWELAALTAAQQAVEVACYVGMGIPALLYFMAFKMQINLWLWYLVLSMGVGTLLFIVTSLLHPQGIYRFIQRHWTHPRVLEVFSFLKHLTPSDIYQLAGLSFLRYLVFATQFVIILYGFHPVISVWEAYIATFLFYYASSVIPSPALGNLGVRGGITAFVFSQFGVASALSVNASFMTYMLNVMVPALIGTGFVLKMRIATRRSLQVQQEESQA